MTKFANEIFYTDFHVDIIEELGEVYAWEISYKLHGQRVYVPKRKDVSDHHQFGLLSPELAEFIVERYAGETISVPMGNNSDYTQRRIIGRGLINRGCNHNEVATKLKVSYSTARRYKKHAKNNNHHKQEELF